MPDVDVVLDQLDLLTGRPRTVRALDGGLTNENLLVEAGSLRCVVRRWASDAELLDIDRDAEHRNAVAAADSGAAPEVLDYRPDLGLMVVAYADGPAWENASFSVPGNPARAGRAIRQLHDGPRFVNDFDMFARQARYRQLVDERGFWMPKGYAGRHDAFARIQGVLAANPVTTVPCNNDLLAANFVDDGDRLWVIDYEYSGNNDPAFELGNTSTECELDDDQLKEVVTAYLGGTAAASDVLPAFLARTRLQALVSAYGWSLWGSIQDATSPLDFDFRGWSQEHFDRAVRGFRARRFDALIATVGG